MNKRLSILFMAMLSIPFFFGSVEAKERGGEVVFQITVDAPENSKDVRLWLPYPVSDSEQKIEDVKIDGNFSSYKIYDQKQEGDRALYAEWTKPVKERSLIFSFKASSVERVKKDFPSKESSIPKEIKCYVGRPVWRL